MVGGEQERSRATETENFSPGLQEAVGAADTGSEPPQDLSQGVAGEDEGNEGASCSHCVGESQQGRTSEETFLPLGGQQVLSDPGGDGGEQRKFNRIVQSVVIC